MKLYQFITIFLISGLLSCQKQQNEVVITGQILGEIPEEVFLALPVNGVFKLVFKDLIKIDRNVYYSAMLVELAKRKWSDEMRMNNGAFTGEMKKMEISGFPVI